MKRYYKVAAALLIIAGLCSSMSAHAQAKVAGSSLLTTADQAQLASWLGEGSIVLSNIYSKTQGDTSSNFHRAADGKGRTFSVMQASNEFGKTWLVGGYNPQSWNSSGQYNMTAEDKDRTAFLFNLTNGTLHKQTPKTYALDSVGSYQTLNLAKFGPTFGTGYDLFVPGNLTTGGYSSIYSYVNTDPNVGVFGVSLIDGSAYHGGNITYGAIEVFTITAVPEPATYGMLLAGLGLFFYFGRRKVGTVA